MGRRYNKGRREKEGIGILVGGKEVGDRKGGGVAWC